MWKWKVVCNSGWSYYTGVAFLDTFESVYDELRKMYPDAISCKIMKVYETTPLICISEHHE